MLEQLGEGGMATVYKAYDTRLETDVAVKVIRTENILPSVLERTLKRFEREAKALARLTHPNIVKVTDFGEHEGRPYLVMVYLPGGTLKQRLGKPIPWQEAIRLLLPIARALDFAHRQNMIHRDVKPSNILITADGEPMLTDFGIAKILDLEETQDLTGTGIGIGTPEYMAPEQWTGKASHLSDQYALGVVFYEMLTGRKPYTADTPAAILLKQATEPLPRPGQFAHDLPEKVEKLLLKALAENPSDRYASMGEFAATLESVLRGTAAPAKPQPARPRQQTADTYATVNQRLEDSTVKEPIAPRTRSSQPAASASSSNNWIRNWSFGLIAVAIVGLIFVLAGNAKLGSNSTSTEPPTQLPVIATEPPTALPATEAPAVQDEITDSKGVTMRLVPAGEFTMGGSADTAYEECQKLYIGGTCEREWFTDEEPAHTVYLDSFYIDKYEVSNAAYRVCVNSGACRPPTETGSYSRSSYYGNSAHDDYPVIYVTWDMANAYCEWRGARLPTEAEWEKAARGPDGLLYPWGNSFDGSRANFCDTNCSFDWANKSYDDGYADTAPVDAYPSGASVYGIFNLAGNVWEWVADWYDSSYYANSPYENPPGPSSGEYRAARGGSWSGDGDVLRPAGRGRGVPSYSDDALGFRCALSP
ncbi:MAG: SUMF1/EgtB/PvdO family nonheme iron enzyme [Chloroflexota bacterium]